METAAAEIACSISRNIPGVSRTAKFYTPEYIKQFTHTWWTLIITSSLHLIKSK